MIGEVEDSSFEIMHLVKNKEKRMKKSEESLCELKDTVIRNNLHFIGIPEGEEREKGQKTYLKK